MKSTQASRALSNPRLSVEADELGAYISTLPELQLQKSMLLSPALATKTHVLMANWAGASDEPTAAAESFIGDIYSGLQVPKWSDDDFSYANEHLSILSGLYGILKPLDGIRPYRLEMGYKMPNEPYHNLYQFWGDSIAQYLPPKEPIIDLTALEYGKTVHKYIDASRVIQPKFLTISPKTDEPSFVTVHAKIARGAFAYWLIREQVEDMTLLPSFSDLGYRYNQSLSTPNQPVYVCKTFGGLGLSIRLQK